MKDTRADLHPCRLLTKRTLRARIVTDKVAVDRLADNSVPCMEPQRSCRVHEPVKGPNTEPNTSKSHSPSYSFEIHFNIVPHLCLDLHSCIIISGFPTKTLYVFPFFNICAPCPAHFILYNFTILIAFCDR